MSTEKTRRAICILGMHRSGTSVIARGVNLLGVYLGEENDLLPPAPDNVEGVWERRDVVDFHNRLLAHFSASWHSLMILPEGWNSIDAVKPFREELTKLVRKAFGDRVLWGWKDPRTTVLMPLWKDVLGDLGVELSCLYVVRNPVEVAKSLQKRDGFSHDKSFGLWLYDNLESLHAIRGMRCAVVFYDRFLEDWERELRRCVAEIGIPWPQDDSQLMETMKGFLRPDLRHSRSTAQDIAAEDAPKPVVSLYRLLERLRDDATLINHPDFERDVSALRVQFTESTRYFQADLARLCLVEHHAREDVERIRDLQGRMQAQEEELRRIHRSVSWKIITAYSKVRQRLLPEKTRRATVYNVLYSGARSIANNGLQGTVDHLRFAFARRYFGYSTWIKRNEPSASQLKGLEEESRRWKYRPKISLVTPVYDPRRDHFVACIESVFKQTYDNWELCLVDGGSAQPYVAKLLNEFSAQDPRVKVLSLSENRGIAGNSNSALKMASGEYVGFLDHDDVLAPFALHEAARALNEDETIDLLYSDEDKIPSRGSRRYDPSFKSDWAPDTMLSYNYLCHFAVVRRGLLEEIWGFREGYDGAQDYDLILRIVQRTKKIRHIPKVLYHWRATEGSTALEATQKPYAMDAARRAIADHLRHRGFEAKVVDGYLPTTYRVMYRIRGNPKVSIIVPTRDKVDLLRPCVESVLGKTNYDNYELVIVDNQSQDGATHRFYESLKGNPRVRIIQYAWPFNFSMINNFAVRSTNAPHLLFLNNDTEVMAPEWLSAMLEYSQREDVGAVGARLLFTDGSIQHAGVIIGVGGVGGHAHRLFPGSSDGHMGRTKIVQNLSAVTAACMMMRRTIFDEVGGFDEGLAYAFNDVDLCLKIREKGYLIVYTPYAELYHHESATRGSDETPERRAGFAKEVEIMKNRWKQVLEAGDPYYSPNLTLERPDFSLKL